MKKLIFTLLFAGGICLTSSAQRFRVGVRAGANLVNYTMNDVAVSGGTLLGGKPKAGFEAALVARLALTKHLNLQTEFEFDRTGYGFDFERDGSSRKSVVVHANRLEIPLFLGINIGNYVRLFGGPEFRVAHREKSSVPSLLNVKFNDSAVALAGGAAVKVGRFFVEGRVTGYPRKTTVWQLTSHDAVQVATVKNHIKWSLTAGVFF